jgi:hypothetical protein
MVDLPADLVASDDPTVKTAELVAALSRAITSIDAVRWQHHATARDLARLSERADEAARDMATVWHALSSGRLKVQP